MFHFILGVAVGSLGLYYYSENIRLKVAETNRELVDLMHNRLEFKREVYKEIQRMELTGELDDVLYHRSPYVKRQEIQIQDVRKGL